MDLNKQRFLDYLFKTFYGSKSNEDGLLYRDEYCYETSSFLRRIDNSINIITNIFGECTLYDVERIISIECLSYVVPKYITPEKLHKIAYRYMGEVMSGIDLGEVDN